jgi:hypothetical protein
MQIVLRFIEILEKEWHFEQIELKRGVCGRISKVEDID